MEILILSVFMVSKYVYEDNKHFPAEFKVWNKRLFLSVCLYVKFYFSFLENC
jgi:hypothetical protein